MCVCVYIYTHTFVRKDALLHDSLQKSKGWEKLRRSFPKKRGF